MISVRGLAHRYGSTQVLRIAQWQVEAGARCLVLGPSGSGKTTLLHILAGLQAPSEGAVSLFGQDLHALRGAQIDRWRGAHVGIVLQALHLIAHLSVRANLRLAQYLARRPQDDAAVDAAL